MNHDQSIKCWIFVLFLAVLMMGGAGPAVADESLAVTFLEREGWWPFESGPHYGEVAEELRDHPRVIRMQVGSFDTRAPGWTIPQSLLLDGDAGTKAGSAWLVQLEGPITDDKKEMLYEAGATIYRFHPVNTFLVRAQDPSKLASLPGVLWVGPYHPAYRIEPALGQAPTIDPIKARNERISVRVRLFERDEKSRVIQKLEQLDAEINWAATSDEYRPDRVYFTATAETILAASRMREVFWVEETSTEAFPLNAETQIFMQTGSLTSGRPFWEAGIDGSTQIVGVMDNGMDVDTILLSHTTTDAGTPGPGHRKVQAYTAWGGGDMTTCNGYTHGTNTSQCAVANRSDFGLDGNLDGVAKGARIVFQDTGAPGSCNLSTPNPMFGMWNEVRANGGHLTNGSFVTCAYGTYGVGAADLDQYGWDNRDFLAFYSGGNGGAGNACPGTNKNHISSGGHRQHPFQSTFYGSYGPAPSGRVGPTVLGPACDFNGGNPAPFNFNTSTSIQSNDSDITGPPSGDSQIVQGVCGTSFSSPYLLGVGALIRDYFEKGAWPSGAINPFDVLDPSGALVKAVLINSGDFMNSCVGCTFGGLMGSMGMGRVNLSSTLALAGDTRTVPGTRVVDRGMSVGLKTMEIFEEYIEVLDASVPLKIVVVWVDQSGSTLTNDLKLTVTGPAGTQAQTYEGNLFGTGPYSLSVVDGGFSNDATNVFESVRINPAELVTGFWRVKIQARNVPMGDPAYGDSQPFALVASGGIDGLGISEVSEVGVAAPLRAISRTATDVTWEWEPLTGDPFIDYSFYRGSIGGLYDHQMIDSSQCGISGGTTTVADAADGQDSYYLVAGHKNVNDGPLGNNRPPASPRCP